MWSKSEAIRILNDHGCKGVNCEKRKEGFCCTPTFNFENMVGIKDEYSTKELKDFLGY